MAPCDQSSYTYRDKEEGLVSLRLTASSLQHTKPLVGGTQFKKVQCCIVVPTWTSVTRQESCTLNYSLMNG